MKQMPIETLFTFVLDWKGGTYLSQVKAPTLKTAKRKWLTLIPLEIFGTHQVLSELATQLATQIDEDEPVLLEGLESVWRTGFMVEEKLALVHVIATCQLEPSMVN